MNGVKFGGYHSYDDWGLILTDQEITSPVPKLETVNAPGVNGVIDLTDSLGELWYEQRQLKFVFTWPGNPALFHQKRTEIANAVHGKTMQIIPDADRSYYWSGRVRLDVFGINAAQAKITVVCDVDPYKYEIDFSGRDWLWDPFSFVDGVIRIDRYTIAGSKTVTLKNRAMITSPVFTATAPMTVTFDGAQYYIPAGTTKVYGIRLQEGDNTLAIAGTGTVDIYFRGGVL